MNNDYTIVNYIQKMIGVTEEEALFFESHFKEVNIKKRQYLVQPGFTAKYRHYVMKGCFRGYVISEEGQEHTISFAVDDWWITDYKSYIYQQPATMFVVAVEDSTIQRIDYETEQRLKKEHHKFEMFFRMIAERGLAFYQRRMIANLTQSAEERYEYFVDRYPFIAQRLPQYALASYPGMTPEFLSRIRNNRTHK